MIKRYRSLNTIFYLREKLKTCSAQFFIEFIESNGLKALAAASDSLGNKDRVTFGDVGAQIELVLCWRTLMNRPVRERETIIFASSIGSSCCLLCVYDELATSLYCLPTRVSWLTRYLRASSSLSVPAT